MNNKGFVFVESIIVLVIVALSLTMLLSSYSLVTTKTREKEYYNRASDKYLLYYISQLGTDENCDYSKICSTDHGNMINFLATHSGNLDNNKNTKNCAETKLDDLMNNNCNQVLSEMEIEYLYVVNNVKNVLNSSNSVRNYDNGALNFMKTLKKCYDNSDTCSQPITYMIGVFNHAEYSEDRYYYAAIEL